jgi:isoamylase
VQPFLLKGQTSVSTQNTQPQSSCCFSIGADDARPSRVISIDPMSNRTYHFGHVYVPGVKPGQIYGYRVSGVFDPPSGMRFDDRKVLLDPYGLAVVVPQNYSRDAARQKGDNTATALKSVVADPSAYDWEGDTPIHRPSSRTIIYETHVRGFTRHASSGIAENKRGTFAGLVEKIPYLKELGVSAIELMPIFQSTRSSLGAGLPASAWIVIESPRFCNARRP